MRLTALVPAALLTLVLAACGGGSDNKAAPSPSMTGPTDVNAATLQVTEAWTGFFDGKKPAAERAALLESGETLTQALAMSAQDPNANVTSAKVTSVTFTDPDHANLKYDLLVAGTPALHGADGKAVRVDGHWKVSKYSFCQLLTLKAGNTVPGC